ncbi:hypothetical protein Tcan_15466 [Toxocara canis]|uniref:Uncharacterized protein n=1 Tax=Toxocara canis TaxID=6265 RepID=A0A0B2V1A0_TOXCA|nr:hypothetical protein Tcan_15466 [Toxocara canis]
MLCKETPEVVLLDASDIVYVAIKARLVQNPQNAEITKTLKSGYRGVQYTRVEMHTQTSSVSALKVNKSTFNVVKSRYVVYRGEDGRVVVRLASPNDQTVATSINEGSRAPSPGHPRSNVFQPVINREGVVHGGTEDGVEEALMQTGETSDESLDQFETGDLFSSSEELIFPFSNES